MTTDLLTEDERMRRVPGIIFANGPTGRQARIAGTGIDFFELIKTYQGCNEDWDCLKQTCNWLSDEQLKAALTYAQVFPHEIAARLERENQIERDGVDTHQRPINHDR